MTKKRFKLSMAALGLLAAFFMVLIAVLLAPTLASANKDGGKHHAPGGAGQPIGGPGGGAHGSPGTDNWNAFGHEHGNAYDAPFCVEGGVYPCAILGDPDAFDGGDPNSFESGYPGGGAQGGEGSPNGGGQYSPTFWSSGGGPGGGNGGAPGGGIGGGPGGGNSGGPGGGNGGPGAGNGPADEKCGKTDEDQSDSSAQDGDETKSCDTDKTSASLTSETSSNLSSNFVDPDFGDDGKPKTEDGPQGGPQGGPQDGPEGENPPTTELTVTEVPEPLTLSLFAVGLAGAAGLRRGVRKA